MSAWAEWTIRSKEDLKEMVRTFGIVPFFPNAIRGFSIQERVDKAIWFTDAPGPWEWKGPVIRELGCAYGKFFEKKAAYVREDVFLDLANYRRDGYDFDARVDDELAPVGDAFLYNLLAERAPVLSKRLKEAGNYKKGGRKGFDTVITRLQEQCYVTVSDFIYETDRFGKQYGWGVAEYSTPEVFFGPSFREKVYGREPEESRARLLELLKTIQPQAEEKTLLRFLK